MLKKQEFWALNWLRFFLAEYLVLFHTLNEPYAVAKTYPVLSALLDLGNFATSVFFVLSGFLLAYVYIAMRDGQSIDKGAFLAARFSALYPVHIFTLILVLPVLFVSSYPHGGIQVPLEVFGGKFRVLGVSETILVFLAHLTMTHAWNPLYLLLNPPSWSLSTLMFFYILFPYFGPWLNKVRSPAIWLVLLGILFSLPGAYAQMAGLTDIVTTGILHRNPVVRLPLFLSGILLCVMYARRSLAGKFKLDVYTFGGLSAVVIIVIAFAAYCQFQYPENHFHLVKNGLYYPAALATVWICANAGPAVSTWSKYWSTRLGRAALSIFVLHFPLYQLFYRGERYVRACLEVIDERGPVSSIVHVAKTLPPSLLLYPVYFFLVIYLAVALQEKLVNPIQMLIKRNFGQWRARRAQRRETISNEEVVCQRARQ